MNIEIANGRRLLALGLMALVICIAPIKRGNATEAGQQLFQSRCAACHTIGKGKLVGPDLAAVTTRREENWLKRQIKEPDRLIAEKDPIAIQLLQQSNNIPMVPLGLSDEEVVAVISYLKSTEKQTNVPTGLPSQYIATLLISLVVLVGLTLVGLSAGKKNVDP